jgi:hypothetical protein
MYRFAEHRSASEMRRFLLNFRQLAQLCDCLFESLCQRRISFHDLLREAMKGPKSSDLRASASLQDNCCSEGN